MSASSAKPCILILINHYAPGNKYGGPVRSLMNLVEWLGDDFHFKILTRDRDFGDIQPYSNYQPGKWYQIGKAEVRYLSPLEQTPFHLIRIFNQTTYDAIYLNITFSSLTISVLLFQKFRLIVRRPIALAPRGTLSTGALSLKSNKKWRFLRLARYIDLYQHLYWHLTSQEEIAEVQQTLAAKDEKHFYMIPNLPTPILSQSSRGGADKQPGEARVIFLSRITPKKNLLFALNCLKDIRGCVYFDIYGRVEDKAYWQLCLDMISTLPSKVKVNYCGEAAFDQVSEILKNYHLFFLPTLGENFGYAILEALCAGCPVLISDRTPWNGVNECGGDGHCLW